MTKQPGSVVAVRVAENKEAFIQALYEEGPSFTGTIHDLRKVAESKGLGTMSNNVIKYLVSELHADGTIVPMPLADGEPQSEGTYRLFRFMFTRQFIKAYEARLMTQRRLRLIADIRVMLLGRRARYLAM